MWLTLTRRRVSYLVSHKSMPLLHYLRLFGKEKAYRDTIILGVLFLVSFFFLALGVILFEIHSVNFSQNLIIHFDFFQGITFLSDTNWVYRTMFLSVLIGFLNLFLAWFFLRRQVFLSYLFGGATVLFSLLIFSALLVIIAVN